MIEVLLVTMIASSIVIIVYSLLDTLPRVKNFNELLDARDNLKLPIIYLNTIPHHEGLLYIINDKNIYLLQVDGEYLSK